MSFPCLVLEPDLSLHLIIVYFFFLSIIACYSFWLAFLLRNTIEHLSFYCELILCSSVEFNLSHVIKLQVFLLYSLHSTQVDSGCDRLTFSRNLIKASEYLFRAYLLLLHQFWFIAHSTRSGPPESHSLLNLFYSFGLTWDCCHRRYIIFFFFTKPVF